MKARREAIDASGAALQAVFEGRRHPWPCFTCPECGSTWYAANTPFWEDEAFRQTVLLAALSDPGMAPAVAFSRHHRVTPPNDANSRCGKRRKRPYCAR